MDGFLNLSKPLGFTSHDCVAKVRRLLKLKRVGHAGTLDPAATGVLPIAVGRATRLLQYLQQDKAYRATIRLGVATTTDDLEGEVLTEQPAPDLSLAAVEAALAQFHGAIQQVPPSYSAIQVDGKRLYSLARAGQVVEVPARTVQVYRLAVLDWRSQDFPELELEIACGPGTYIRAIARDLGQSLQVGGTLAALQRTHSSGFELADSVTFEQLEDQLQAGTFQQIAPAIVLGHLETVVLAADLAGRWCQGQRVNLSADIAPTPPNVPLGIYDSNQQFLGIGQQVQIDGQFVLVPTLVFKVRDEEREG